MFAQSTLDTRLRPFEAVKAVRRLMAKRPEARYQTAGELSRELAGWTEREQTRLPVRTGDRT